MAKLSSFLPSKLAGRRAQSPYESLPTHAPIRGRQSYAATEKQWESDSDSDSETDDDMSSPPSTNASRSTSGSYGSYASNTPMLPTSSQQRPARLRPSVSYPVPHRIVRYLCFGMISMIVLFIVALVRMSQASNKRIEVGDVGERPPPPPPTWESFSFLSRYYGGIRSLVPLQDNVPEYPWHDDDDYVVVPKTKLVERKLPTSQPLNPYPDYNSTEYLKEFMPVQECFLHAKSTTRIPKLQYFTGRPDGFPTHVIGDYGVLDWPEGVCFERYGRLGPYGHGYSTRSGGLGTGLNSTHDGSQQVWSVDQKTDYRKVDWADVQRRCVAANAARFVKSPTSAPAHEVHFHDPEIVSHESHPANGSASKTLLHRTAVVVRTWDEFLYREEDIMYLRALVAELSMGSGGEFDVHLLVQVKDNGIPIWADEHIYQAHLRKSVPREFWGITTLWSQTQMLVMYEGLHDEFTRGPTLPVHGEYRGLMMALQWFAHQHPEYEYFWHWEMDVRYTGHFYQLFTSISSWARQQPRKYLWERNSRFYVPQEHGSWDDFSHMVRVQSEMGTESANNIWSGIDSIDTSQARSKGDRSIWGPERPYASDDWFEIENDPVPPTSFEKDRYSWGVDEDADLITLNPIFDPDGTTWGLSRDVTGYNTTERLPPRRSAIVTTSRLSRRLLTTMHRETAIKKHHSFPEMWPATIALHHGYKAVYAPHPMFVERAWPLDYLETVMNAGRNGATGGARTSVFGDREHNMRGMSWYYNAHFAGTLWARWLGLAVNNDGGEAFELDGNPNLNANTSNPVNAMAGGEGRMCLPPMLLHPIKGMDLVSSESLAAQEDDETVDVGDPAA